MDSGDFLLLIHTGDVWVMAFCKYIFLLGIFEIVIVYQDTINRNTCVCAYSVVRRPLSVSVMIYRDICLRVREKNKKQHILRIYVLFATQ
jgi:hypothetical protein